MENNELREALMEWYLLYGERAVLKPFSNDASLKLWMGEYLKHVWSDGFGLHTLTLTPKALKIIKDLR